MGSRNDPVLFVGQDRKTSNAIVVVGMWAEFTRMRDGERLPG